MNVAAERFSLLWAYYAVFVATTIVAILAINGVSSFELPLKPLRSTGIAIETTVTAGLTCQAICSSFHDFTCVDVDDDDANLDVSTIGVVFSTSRTSLVQVLQNCSKKVNWDGGTLLCLCEPRNSD